MSFEYGCDGHLVVDSEDGFLYGINADENITNFYEHTISAEIVALTQKIHQGLHGVDGHRSLHGS